MTDAKHRRLGRLLVALALLLSVLGLTPAPARAASFTVTTLADSGLACRARRYWTRI